MPRGAVRRLSSPDLTVWSCRPVSLEALGALDAVVFDMDGVLLDSEPLHLAALNRVIGEEGHSYDHEQNRRFVGASLADTWTTVHAELSLAWPLEHYYRRYDDEVLQVLRTETLRPLPGVSELLEALMGLESKIGLATQSHRLWVEATLAGLSLNGVFAAVVTGDSVARGKPYPDLYLRACELLGADPRQSLAIEDSLPGARSARAAGMRVVGVRNQYAGAALECESDVLVDRVDELLWRFGAQATAVVVESR